MQLSYNINPSVLPSGGGTSTFGGGSVMPNFSSTSLETQAINTGKQILNAIPFGGVISSIGDLLGIGPEDWASVESRFKGFYQQIENEAKRRLNLAKTLEDITDVDKYLATASMNYSDVSGWDSANSKNAHALVGSMIDKLLQTLRSEFKSLYNYTARTSSNEGTPYKDPRGFVYERKNQFSYFEYSAKNSKPKTSVKPTKTTTNLTASFTDSVSSVNNEVHTEESFKYWYLLLIPFVVYGGVQLFKKLKKKKK